MLKILFCSFKLGAFQRIVVSKAHCGRAVFRFSLVLFFLSGAGPTLAQRNIGSAITVERDVSGALAGRTRVINTGDRVFSNENVRTANASAAQLQFLDESRIAIGPSASVVLTRFIYNPDQTARQAVLLVAAGAARWVGGASPPRAYQVRTPHVAIGVRGTAFDLLVEARRTIVILREGVIDVCPIRTPQRCTTLATPGQVVIVTPSGVEGPAPVGPSPTQFTERCLRPIDRAACLVTTTAELSPAPAWGGFYAGVHGGGEVSSPASIGVGGTASVLDSIAAGNVPSSLEPQGLGALGGVQVGYLWQFGSAVFGLEADSSAMSARARAEVTLNACGCLSVTTSATHNVDYLGTIRGRAGIAVGDLLAFGTAGLAVGHIKLDGSIVPIPAANPTYVGSRSLLQAGYVVGGGIEVALANPLSVRAEFLHYDLGKQSLVLDETTGLAPGESATMQFRTRGNLVRAGINMLFASSATAADIAIDARAPVYKAPPPPVFSWTGFYAGAHGGAGWARKDWFFDGCAHCGVAGADVGPGPEGSHLTTGGLAGGQIGYNYQIGSFVWGIETQASWASLKGDNISLLPLATNRNITLVDALGTVAGRVGIAWDRTLLYGTAGGAWAIDKYRIVDLSSGGTLATASETRWGWMVGIGLERAFLANWSVKIEYNYVSFGTNRVTLVCSPVFCGVPTSVPEDIGQNVSLIKAGINYRFGGPITAKY